MKAAIYPGSFDPITKGHIDVIERALKIFDRVIIAVGENLEKKSFFTTKEKIWMIRESTGHLKNIEIDSFSGLLLGYVKKKKCNVILRGLRAVSDFEFEFQRALMNRKLDGDIETVFIMTKEDYVFLNSGIVKEIAQFKGNVSQFVPEAVAKKLKGKFP